MLVVTGRSTNQIDTFVVGKDGLLCDTKSFNVAPGGTPFGFDFDRKGHLLVSLAGVGGSSGAASYAVERRLDLDDHRADRERPARRLLARRFEGRPLRVRRQRRQLLGLHVRRRPRGTSAFVRAVAVHGMTALDLAQSHDGRYLYVLAAGTHGIVPFEVGDDGTLTYVGSQLNIPATAAGLAVR